MTKVFVVVFSLLTGVATWMTVADVGVLEPEVKQQLRDRSVHGGVGRGGIRRGGIRRGK